MTPLKPFTPKDWLKVAGAITEDANDRVGNGMVTRARKEAGEKYRRAIRETGVTGVGHDEAARELRRAQIAAGSAAATLKDLAVHIGPGASAGTGAPAYYREHDREIVLDSAVALPGVDPESVRWDDPLWRAEHLRAAGLVEHEVGHAAHTPKRCLREWHEAGPQVGHFATRLEETRMEASTLRAGGDRAALAGVAHELILRDFEGVSGDAFADALDAALILGRSELVGGSLTEDDVRPFRDAYAARHGAEWVESLEELLRDWNSTEDADVPDGAGMAELRDSWRSAIGEGSSEEPDAGTAPGESGEGGESSESTDGGSSGGDESGGGAGDDTDDDDDTETSGGGDQADDDDDDDEADDTDGGGSGGGGDDDEADDDDTEADGGDAIRDMLEQAAGEAGTKAAQAARDMREQQEEDDRKATDEISHGYSPGHGRHHAQRTEAVTADDRRVAVKLAQELRQLALPVVTRDRVAAQLPPGRLRGRGAVSREGQLAAGMVPTAEPFRSVRKTATQAPPPVIGVMLDVSGSMGAAQRPAAVAAWALAEAGRAVQARTAMVTFGDRGRLVDHNPTLLTVTQCGGSWENFREGFALLDRKLKLTAPARGVRLLIVVSDGALVGPDEGESACRVMRRLESQGVACIWAAIGTKWAGNWGEGWTNRAGHVVQSPASPLPIIEGVAAAMRRVQVTL